MHSFSLSWKHSRLASSIVGSKSKITQYRPTLHGNFRRNDFSRLLSFSPPRSIHPPSNPSSAQLSSIPIPITNSSTIHPCPSHNPPPLITLQHIPQPRKGQRSCFRKPEHRRIRIRPSLVHMAPNKGPEIILPAVGTAVAAGRVKVATISAASVLVETRA